MAVVQDVYDIPVDIATKILTGEYRRIGSVVRHAAGPHKGQIVKHLRPVNLKAADEAKGLGTKMVQLAINNKKTLVIVGIGIGVAAVGTGIYYKIRNYEPKVVHGFRVSLKIYIEAIRQGSMDISKINSLMNALEELKRHKDYTKINIQLTTEELEILVSRIYEYTIKLANDNSVDLTEDELFVSDEEETNSIANLHKYLKAQRRIFEIAA